MQERVVAMSMSPRMNTVAMPRSISTANSRGSRTASLYRVGSRHTDRQDPRMQEGGSQTTHALESTFHNHRYNEETPCAPTGTDFITRRVTRSPTRRHCWARSPPSASRRPSWAFGRSGCCSSKVGSSMPATTCSSPRSRRSSRSSWSSSSNPPRTGRAERSRRRWTHC